MAMIFSEGSFHEPLNNSQWFWLLVIFMICVTLVWVTWLIAVARKEVEKDKPK